MTIRPTPITAALAGIFSAIAWPWLWSRYGGSATSGDVEMIIATLLVVALPAHAFVVGFAAGTASGGRTLDTAFLQRVAAWLVAGAATVLLVPLLSS